MELFYNPISTYSQKVIMALEEKGLSYSKNLVELSDPQSRKTYRSIYPLGKVPVLQVGELVLGESTTIVEWLEHEYPQVSLIPNEHAWDIRRLDRLIDHYLIANISLLFFQSLKPQAQQVAERMHTAQRQIGVVMKQLEFELSKREGAQFIVGDNISLADLGLIPALASIGKLINLNEFPILQGYSQQQQSRPSFITARAEFDGAVAKMVAAFSG